MGRDMLLLLVLLRMAGNCCCSSSNCGGCPTEERSALLGFKQELDDPYDLLISWKGLYCCSWLGITCDRGSGHVVHLYLNTFGYDLSAVVRNSFSRIFPALFQLQHLEYLDLSWIDLSPLPFPSHLPSLTRLTHLSLQACGLAGPIPSEINLSRLEYLDISGNDNLELRQSGSWLRNLRGLEELYMYGVNVTSVIENVASLTKLTSLGMSWVSGTTLSSLVNLTSLSHLNLVNSDLAHQPFPIWISNLTSLVTLQLYACALHGSIPSTVLGLPHLRNLRLSNIPDLRVNLSSIVQHASQLRSLSIGYSNVGGVIPISIGTMSWLTSLDLHGNKIGGIIPPAVGNMSSLAHLDLSNNKIECIIPPSIGKMSTLTYLDLSYNSLRGTIPWSYLVRLYKLSTLCLESSQLNEKFLSTFGNLSSLEVFLLAVTLSLTLSHFLH